MSTHTPRIAAMMTAALLAALMVLTSLGDVLAIGWTGTRQRWIRSPDSIVGR